MTSATRKLRQQPSDDPSMRAGESHAPGMTPVDGTVHKTSVVAARGVGKRFGERCVLSDVDLEVGTGCVFGLLGRNGAGKTTLLRILLGLVAPDSGSSSVLGMDSSKDGTGVRQACGTVLGTGAVYGELSVWDNVEFAARAWGVPRSRRRAAVEEALAWGGVAERRSDKARVLSQGMRQRVALARAVVHEPKVLVLDEPTSGLDVPAANALRDHVRRWSDQSGAAVILTSHDLYEMDRICDRIGFLQEQTLVAVQRPETGSAKFKQGWFLRFRRSERGRLPALGNPRGVPAPTTVEAEFSEIECASLAEAKQRRAAMAKVAAGPYEIVLRHAGDLAGVFTKDADEGEGLGWAR